MNMIADVVFASDTYGNITVWDLKCGTNLMTYKSGAIVHRSLNILHNDYLLAVEKGALIYAWPLNSQEKLQTVRMVCPGVIGCLALSPDGLFIAVSIDNRLLIWQISTGKLLNTVSSHYQAITVIRWSSDSNDIVTGGEDGLVCVWKLSHLVSANYMYFGISSDNSSKSQSDPRFVFSDHSIKVVDLYIGSDGQRTRLFTASVDKSCKVYDLTTGKQLLSIVFDVRPTSLAVDSAEMNVYVGTSDGSIKTFSLLEPPRSLTQHFDDKRESSFVGHKKSINCLALSTDETTLVSGSADETIKLWYISNKQCVRTIRMRGSITNIVVRTLSKKFNTSQFQPKCVLKSFQKRYDDNPREMMELYCPQDLEVDSPRNEDYQESETSALRAKVDELKRINQELFIFAKNKILEQTESDECHRESTLKVKSLVKTDSEISREFTKSKKRKKK